MKNILLNRRRTYGGNKTLPYDSEIEYLESNGNCIIDTGYVPTGDDIHLLTKVYYNGYVTMGQWIAWFSAYTSESNNAYRIIRSSAYDSAVLMYNGTIAGGGGTSFNVSVGTLYNIDFNRNTYNINGTTGTLSSYKGTQNTATMNLFSTNFKGRFYGFTIYKNDVLQLDLIPVRVGQVGYMYDKVSGRLLGNGGTGTFILGNDKN